MSLDNGQIVGSYRVLKQLGKGGVGSVYLAIHQHIHRQVALKVLNAEYANNPDVVSRFLHEARVVNLLKHPGLVQVSDFGQLPDGTVYIVMEYLEGKTLLDLLREHGRLDELRALEIANQIASTLAAAHAKRIIHRDLKPENIILEPDPALRGERVKVLDFGLAKQLDAKAGVPYKTRSGELLGTPVYMSPEQCRGDIPVQEATDVYSLGIVLYEMLAGRPPFLSESVGMMLVHHLSSEPPLLVDMAPSVSPKVAHLVHQMMRKDPAQRPTMQQVSQLLAERISESEPSGHGAFSGALQESAKGTDKLEEGEQKPPLLALALSLIQRVAIQDGSHLWQVQDDRGGTIGTLTVIGKRVGFGLTLGGNLYLDEGLLLDAPLLWQRLDKWQKLPEEERRRRGLDLHPEEPLEYLALRRLTQRGLKVLLTRGGPALRLQPADLPEDIRSMARVTFSCLDVLISERARPISEDLSVVLRGYHALREDTSDVWIFNRCGSRASDLWPDLSVRLGEKHLDDLNLAYQTAIHVLGSLRHRTKRILGGEAQAIYIALGDEFFLGLVDREYVALLRMPQGKAGRVLQQIEVLLSTKFTVPSMTCSLDVHIELIVEESDAIEVPPEPQPEQIEVVSVQPLGLLPAPGMTPMQAPAMALQPTIAAPITATAKSQPLAPVLPPVAQPVAAALLPAAPLAAAALPALAASPAPVALLAPAAPPAPAPGAESPGFTPPAAVLRAAAPATPAPAPSPVPALVDESPIPASSPAVLLDAAAPDTPAAPLLVLQELTVRKDRRTILENVSLEIAPRGLHTIMGPAGTGKSTLLKAVTGRLSAMDGWGLAGAVLYLGEPVGLAGTPALVEQKLSYTATRLRSLLGDVAMSVGQGRSVKSLLQLAGLSRLGSYVDRALEDPQLKLTPGEVRCLAILRSLADEPALLCIDEPTAELDEEDSELVLRLLKQQSSQRSVLMVTHRQDHAQKVSDTVGLLAGGRLRSWLPAQQFFAAPPTTLLRHYLRTGGCPTPAPDTTSESLDPSYVQPLATSRSEPAEEEPPATPAAAQLRAAESSASQVLWECQAPILSLRRLGLSLGRSSILRNVSLDVGERGLYLLVVESPTESRQLCGFLSGQLPLDKLTLTGTATYLGQPIGELGWGASAALQPQLLMKKGFSYLAEVAPKGELPQREWVEHILKELGLRSLCERLDQPLLDLETLERRQVAIARALHSASRFLCLDAPFDALSDTDGERMAEFLRQCGEKRAILITERDARHAKRLGAAVALLREPPPSVKGVLEAPAADSVSAPAPATSAAYGAGPSGFRWLRPGSLAGTQEPGLIGDLDTDLDLLRGAGVTVLVTLTEHPLSEAVLNAHGLKSLFFPIPDMRAPSIQAAASMCEQVASLLASREVVAFHCRAGHGRTGTALASLLIWEGQSAEDALATVRRVEPRWVQSEEQEQFLSKFAGWCRDHRPSV